MDECAKRSAVLVEVSGEATTEVRTRGGDPGTRRRRATLCVEHAYARGSHCRPGGDDSRRCWFSETTVGQSSFGNRVCVASCLRHVRCLRFFVRFSREGCGTSFRAAHTRRDHGRARQARYRPQAHPRLPRCAARHLRELHEVHRARYETSRKDTRKPHPSPNPRGRFPFGTREPVPGRVSESRFSIRHPLGFERALRRSRLPVPHRSRAKTPLVPPQPPARPRSSSGSASSASCSWFLSCTKR